MLGKSQMIGDFTVLTIPDFADLYKNMKSQTFQICDLSRENVH